MKKFKIKKFLIYMFYALFIYSSSQNVVVATESTTESNNKFLNLEEKNDFKEFDKELFFKYSGLLSNEFDKLSDVNISKNVTDNIVNLISDVLTYFDNFKKLFDSKKITCSSLSPSFMQKFIVELLSLESLISKQINNNSLSKQFSDSNLNLKLLQDFSKQIFEFKKYFASVVMIKVFISNMDFTFDCLLSFNNHSNNFYDIVLKLGEDFLSVDELKSKSELIESFFYQIKKLTKYCTIFIESFKKLNSCSSNSRFVYFLFSTYKLLIYSSSKIFKACEMIFKGDKNSLYEKLCSLNSDYSKTIDDFIKLFNRWCDMCNMNLLGDIQFKFKDFVALNLKKLRLFYDRICAIDNCFCIKNFNDFSSDFFKYLSSNSQDLQVYVRTLPIMSWFDLNSNDWVYFSFIELLKQIKEKICNILNKQKINKENSNMLKSLSDLLNYFASYENKISLFVTNFSKENPEKFIETKVYCGDFFYFRDGLENFDSDCKKIVCKLGQINNSSHYDYCRSELSSYKIKKYLDDLNEIFMPLKQKLSKIFCFNQYAECYEILKNLNKRFEQFNFKDEDGKLKKLSDLTYLCGAFVNCKGYFKDGLLEILKNLDSRLEVYLKDDSCNLNWEFLTDIDLILSLFELIGFEFDKNSFDVKNKCFSLLFSKNSNIVYFLNKLASKVNFNGFKSYHNSFESYFEEPAFVSFSVDLHRPEEKFKKEFVNSIEYAGYIIYKLKCLRSRFFRSTKDYKKLINKNKNLSKSKYYSEDMTTDFGNSELVLNCCDELVKNLFKLSSKSKTKSFDKEELNKVNNLIKSYKETKEHINKIVSESGSMFKPYASLLVELCDEDFEKYENYFNKFNNII